MVQAPFLWLIRKPYKTVKIALRFWQLGMNPFKLGIYLTELQTDFTFWSHIKSEIKQAQKSFNDPKLGGWMLDTSGLMLYSLIRLTKPEVVVETGVGPGGTSALILNALDRNKKGHLYSIDLPGYDAIIYPKIGRCYNIHVPPGYETGWLVPTKLRYRWTLILGDSKEELPKLVDALNHIDIFLHDSLHTDEHVLFELETVFPKVRKGGLLLADDVNEYWSLAFMEFCKKHALPYLIFNNRLGISVKSRSGL